MQGFLPLASFRRSRVSGQVTFTVFSLHISNIYATKKSITKKLILTLRVLWFLKKLLWLRAISVALRGVVAAETTSVLLTKPLLTVSNLRHRPAHHCGDLDLGQTFADFSNHRVLNVLGKWTSRVHSPSHGKHSTWDQNDQSCHHETWLHLDFVDWSNTWSKQSCVWAAHFPERTTCRMLIRPKNVLAKSWATTRSRPECVTIHTMIFSRCRSWHSPFRSTFSSSLDEAIAPAWMGPCHLFFFLSSVPCITFVIWISSHNMSHRA